jgi:hypothetical protein
MQTVAVDTTRDVAPGPHSSRAPNRASSTACDGDPSPAYAPRLGAAEPSAGLIGLVANDDGLFAVAGHRLASAGAGAQCFLPGPQS